MLDCLSGGRLIAGFVFGTPMDSAFSYGMPPIELRERFHEARELILQGVGGDGAVRVQRQVHQAALRQLWPRPVQNEAADLGARLRQPGDLGPGQRQRLLLRPPLVLGPAVGQADGRRATGTTSTSAAANMNPNRMAFTQI